MNFRQTGRKGAIAAIVAVFAACAPIGGPGSGLGIYTGVPLPGGPLNQLPRATLRGLEQQVTWVGCVTAPRTGLTSSTQATIEICAAQYANVLGFPNTNGNGVLTARMINRGAHPDLRWRLTPGDTSFIVSFPKSAAEGSYAILEIPKNTVPGTTVRVVIGNGQFVYCGHPQEQTSSASFYTCATRAAAAMRSPSLRTPDSGPSADDEEVVQDLDGPAWVTCRAGCCTTEQI